MAQKTGKQEAFFKMQAGLMFRLHYTNLGKIVSMQVLGGGKNAKPVLVITNKGKYVFKPINQNDEGINLKGVLKVKPSQYFVDFMKYLADRGIPFVKFIQKDDKSYTIHFGNVDYMCMEFKEGISFMEGYTPFNIDTLFAQPYNKKMGELAARLHNAQKEHPEYLSDPALGDVTKMTFIESFDPVAKAEIFNREPEKKKTHLKFSQLIKKQCEIFLRNYGALNKKNFKRGFIHSDINPENVRFDEDKEVSGVFDFDFSHYDYRIAEFFNLIMCYKAPQTKFKDILTAYQATLYEPLNEDEIRGIIEYVRFKHITTPSIAYSGALEKFAADFSTEEQISRLVQEILSIPASINKTKHEITEILGDMRKNFKQMKPGETYRLPVRHKYSIFGHMFSIKKMETGKKEQFLMRRNVDEIIESGFAAGCSDYSKVFYKKMEEKGYEARIIVGVPFTIDAISSYFSDHYIVAVKDKLKDNWILVDSTSKEILDENWDITSDIFMIGRQKYFIGYNGELGPLEAKVNSPETLKQLNKEITENPKFIEMIPTEIVGFKFEVDNSMKIQSSNDTKQPTYINKSLAAFLKTSQDFFERHKIPQKVKVIIV